MKYFYQVLLLINLLFERYTFSSILPPCCTITFRTTGTNFAQYFELRTIRCTKHYPITASWRCLFTFTSHKMQLRRRCPTRTYTSLRSIPFHTFPKKNTIEKSVSTNSITVNHPGIKILEDERNWIACLSLCSRKPEWLYSF